MNDDGNGSYSYSYSVTRNGTFSIYIFSRITNHIDAWLYSDANLTNLADTTVVSQVEGNWTGYESIYLKSNLKGPTCGSVTITAYADDGYTFIRDGITLWDGFGRHPGPGNFRFTTSFNYEQYYEVHSIM